MKKLLVLGVAVLVAVPVTAAMGGSGRDRATGGGQILVSSNGGAGDTIAFTAQVIESGSTAAKGEVQIIDRTGDGTGRGGVRFHGDVFCMVAESGQNGGMAEIAYRPKGQPGGDIDQLFVLDAGEPNQGNDMIFINENPQTTCDLQDDSDDDGQIDLARGNAQVYDGD